MTPHQFSLLQSAYTFAQRAGEQSEQIMDGLTRGLESKTPEEIKEAILERDLDLAQVKELHRLLQHAVCNSQTLVNLLAGNPEPKIGDKNYVYQ